MKRADDFRATLTVSHLGAIEHAEIEVRPLTLFFGPNGTNKTWTAYGLYGLLEECISDSTVLSRLVSLKEVEQRAGSIKTGSDLLNLIAGLILPHLDAPLTIELAQPSLTRLLGLSRSVEPTAALQLVISTRGSLWPNWPTDGKGIEEILQSDIVGRLLQLNTKLWLQGSPGQDLIPIASVLLAQQARARLLALPAERKALTMLHEQLSALATASFIDRAESESHHGITLSAAVSRRRLEAAARLDRSLPKPSVDFIAFLNTLAHQRIRRFTASEPLAQRLEASLLGGAIDFTDDPSGTLNFTTKGRSIDLHISSSLARAMAGLDLFLRYEATPGSFILIDEPEMNAHPRTQLAIAEFIALMVNHGLRVIATTHSPYIVDHLHNLMEAGRLSPERQQAVAPKFRLGTADAFLDPEQVATWLFTEHGTVENAFDRKQRSIDWQTFSAATDDMANLYSELLAEAGDEVDDDDA